MVEEVVAVLDPRHAVGVVGKDGLQHALVDLLQLVDLFRRGAFRGAARGIGFQQQAQFERLVDVAVHPTQHHRAAVAFALDQAVGDQPVDGAAHRRAADGKLGRDMLFAQALARQEHAGHQPSAEFPID
ncbi:hypothetical protein G6F35_013228 [Rhizopus arrhizus]|nr:hypothetical protein G6F35_013228 [Rhizopus arrhizus]